MRVCKRLFEFALFLSCILMTGCMKLPQEEEVVLSHTHFPEEIAKLPAPPPVITSEEKATAWCQEYTLGTAFAAEGDYYRATTCFHRARHLVSQDLSFSPTRRAQIVRALILSYVVADKPQEAIDVWEKEQDKIQFHDRELAEDTICLLIDAYYRLKREKDAEKILSALPLQSVVRDKLLLYHAIGVQTDQASAETHAAKLGIQKEISETFVQFTGAKKSPTRAAIYNALLPGAGYFYVGQYKTAGTALFMNALFIGATAEFIAMKIPAAAILSGGFELGWYGGGIMGAKLAAELYNRHLRETLLKSLLEKNALFPIQTMHYRW